MHIKKMEVVHNVYTFIRFIKMNKYYLLKFMTKKKMLNNHHHGGQFRLEKQQVTLLGVWQYIDMQFADPK